MNENKKESCEIEAVVAIIAAAILIAIAVILFLRATVYKKYGVRTKAVITKIETELPTYVLGMKSGKTIPVRYMEDNPYEVVYAKGLYLPPVILFIFATLSLSFTSFYFAEKLRRLKLGKAKKESEKISAVIDEAKIGKISLCGLKRIKITCSDECNKIFETSVYTKNPKDYTSGKRSDFYVYNGKYYADLQQNNGL